MSTFGRLLAGHRDALIGFEQTVQTVDDPSFVATSGSAEHAIVRLTGGPNGRVEGMVFEVIDDELAKLDEYEPDGYERIATTLESGKRAWVYAKPQP